MIALLHDAAPETQPKRGAAGVRIDRAIAAVVEAKRTAGCRPAYVESLRAYLGLFARGREECPLAAFTVDTVEEWFTSRNEAAVTQASNIGRLSALFSYAVRRKWIQENPCDLLERVRIDQKPPVILSPLQCGLIMDWCRRRKPNQAAFFTLALYAGVRPDEISRLTWAAVNLDDGTLTIDAAASRVRRRRIVYLEPLAVQWLAWAKERGGRLPVTKTTRRRYLSQACRILELAAWPQDCLRHTAASFLLARHRDAGKVAMQLGNSVRVLETKYKQLVPAKVCEEFWSFTPDSPRPEKPTPIAPSLDPVKLPTTFGVAIDPTWTRFSRAEAALKAEPMLRALGRQRQIQAGYEGAVMQRQVGGDKVDTIGELGRIAFCSRQTLQWCKHILRMADPDILDALRKGRLSIAGTYRKLLAE